MLAPSNPPVAVWVMNRTALPPGRTWGQRCEASPRVRSSSVMGVGVPPAAGIRDKGPEKERATIMLPSSPQLPPVKEAAEPHKVMAGPPSTEIFLSLLCEKNATHWPSGEKKGLVAPC